MANLNFIKTRTVEQFKDADKVERIDVKQNSTTNKLFIAYGAKTGAVSLKGIPTHPMLSLVNPDIDREPTEEESLYIGVNIKVNGKSVSHPKANGFFWLLHEEGQGGAPVVASF